MMSLRQSCALPPSLREQWRSLAFCARVENERHGRRHVVAANDAVGIDARGRDGLHDAVAVEIVADQADQRAVMPHAGKVNGDVRRVAARGHQNARVRAVGQAQKQRIDVVIIGIAGHHAHAEHFFGGQVVHAGFSFERMRNLRKKRYASGASVCHG